MGDPRWNMCQRADAAPSYMSLPGSVGDRIRSTMSFGSGTICRGPAPASPGCGMWDRKVACCEKCSATLVSLKKQALSLAVHHHFSCKVSKKVMDAFTAFLAHTEETFRMNLVFGQKPPEDSTSSQ